MIYIDPQDLGWEPYIDSWIGKMKDEAYIDFFSDLKDKWINKLFRARKNCNELVKCLDINIVVSLTKVMDAFLKNYSTIIGFEHQNKDEIYWALLEKWFTFSLIWSFGATVDETGRKLIDYSIRDIESMFPAANTVFDYCINNDKNEWSSWEEKVNSTIWKMS